MNLRSMNLLRSVLLLGAVLIFFKAGAQGDLTLYHNQKVPQATYTNPALTPQSNVNIGIPAISAISTYAGNSGFNWNHLVKEADGGDSLQLTPDDAMEEMADLNYLTSSTRLDLIHVGIRTGKHYFTLNVTQKFRAQFSYPQEFMQLLWEGNGGELLGQRASLEGLGFDLMHYREYALGYARPLSEKIKIGAKVKYLSGFQNFYTEKSSLGLKTDEDDFGLTVDGSMTIRSSGLDSTGPEMAAFGAGNPGLGLDLGGVYSLNDKIDLSLSVLDIGYIKWNNETRGFENEEVNFQYEGVDVFTLYGQNDTTKEDVGQLITDSLNKSFDLEEKNEGYTTPLNPKVHIGGTYKLLENGRVGALLRGTFVKGRLRGALSLSYQHRLGNWFTGTINYSMYNRSYGNIGLGIVLNGGPIQWHVMTDNVLAPLIPHKVRNLQIQTGFNLTFGRGSDEEGTNPSF